MIQKFGQLKEEKKDNYQRHKWPFGKEQIDLLEWKA